MQLYNIVAILLKAKALTNHLLKLVFWKEKEVNHLAQWNADWLDISNNTTLTVNIDDLHASEFQEVPPGGFSLGYSILAKKLI